MKVKDVQIKKIAKILDEADDELYIVSISFQNGEPVLNLYKPYDDSRLKQEKYQAALSELLQWIKDLDEHNSFV